MRVPRADALHCALIAGTSCAPSAIAVNTPSSIAARIAAVRWYAWTVSKNSSGDGAVVVAMGMDYIAAAGKTKEQLMKAIFTAMVLVAGVCAGVGAQQQDFSKVEIKTTKIGGNFYML